MAEELTKVELQKLEKFLLRMYSSVWEFTQKREERLAGYLGIVVTVIAVMGYAIIKGKGIFPAMIISIIILFWGAHQVILTNYDYRINQAFSWAIETFFCARENEDISKRKTIIHKDFGRGDKPDLILIYKVHLIIFLIAIFLVYIVGAWYLKFTFTGFNCTIFLSQSELCIPLIIIILGFLILIYLWRDRKKKFNDCFGEKWREDVEEFIKKVRKIEESYESKNENEK